MLQSHLNIVEENGFVILRNVVPPKLIRDVVEAIERRRSFLDGIDSKACSEVISTGFFPMWNASALWRVRELLSVQAPFESLYGNNNLWVSLDRCGYRPALSNNQGSLAFHWDDDPNRWDFAQYQGVIALSDIKQSDGVFVCVPELYNIYKKHGKKLAATILQCGSFDEIEIPLNAGDLLLFDFRLAHGTKSHCGPKPRIVQYLAYLPVKDSKERERRFECWKQGTWRGQSHLTTYGVPDEQSPHLSDVGWKALLGNNISLDQYERNMDGHD